jgi:hypothetical protein
MAKYRIHHACGHETEIQLFGKISDREREIARLEKAECPACRAAVAQKAAKEAGLPALTGSDKQVSWASDIRAKAAPMFAAAAEKVAAAVARNPNDPQAALAPAILSEIEKMRQNTAAKWWIETGRTLDASAILRAAVSAVRK